MACNSSSGVPSPRPPSDATGVPRPNIPDFLDHIHTGVESTLRQILELMQNEEKRQQQKADEDRREQDVNSLAQLCSMFAAIYVFIAALGATFLQYVQSTFDNRGASDKASDRIIEAFLFSSVLLSLASSICLVYGAVISTDLMRRPVHPSVVLPPRTIENLGVLRILFPQPRPPQDRPARTVEWQTERLADMLTFSVGWMVYSVICFVVGLLIFAWAEKSRAVSIPLTTILSCFLYVFILSPVLLRFCSSAFAKLSNLPFTNLPFE